MSGILFLAHRVPFPPDRGDKIRSHHVLRALTGLGPVHVGCFAESAADRDAERDLARLAASWCMPTRSKPLPLAGGEALLRHEPVSLAAFRHPALAKWVRRTIEREKIDVIYVFSGQMGQYVPDDWQGRLLVDLVDVDSAKFEAYARDKRPPMRWIDTREARLLRREEARLAARADRTLLVTEAEAALFRERLPAGTNARVAVLGNGVDADLFDPARVQPHPDLVGPGPHFTFTGQMDYKPNVDAALCAIERIMPRIRAVHPGAQFHVVGRAPAPELLTHDGANGTRVWGEVADVRPFLAGAAIVMAPLSIARGVQNKVLEAMASQRLTICSTAAAEGIDAVDGEHLLVAHSPEQWAQHVELGLNNVALRQRIAAAARQQIEDAYSWDSRLAPMLELIAGERVEA